MKNCENLCMNIYGEYSEVQPWKHMFYLKIVDHEDIKNSAIWVDNLE